MRSFPSVLDISVVYLGISVVCMYLEGGRCFLLDLMIGWWVVHRGDLMPVSGSTWGLWAGSYAAAG